MGNNFNKQLSESHRAKTIKSLHIFEAFKIC